MMRVAQLYNDYTWIMVGISTVPLAVVQRIHVFSRAWDIVVASPRA